MMSQIIRISQSFMFSVSLLALLHCRVIITAGDYILTTSTITVENVKASSTTTEYPDNITCPVNHYKLIEVCWNCGCARRQVCDAETGYCPGDGRCKKGRHGQGCVLGIISIRNDKANPGETTNATCTIRTTQPDQDTKYLQLAVGHNPGRWMKPEIVEVLEPGVLQARFLLRGGLLLGDNITCALRQPDGQMLSKTSDVELYDLPVIYEPPQIGEPYADFVTLTIRKWDPGKGDSGDGPITGYIIKACQVTQHQPCVEYNNPRIFQFMSEQPAFESLPALPVVLYQKFSPGAVFKFTYSAKRTGANSVGPPSPAVTYKIPCKRPSMGPEINQQYNMSLIEGWKKVNVSIAWRLPEQSHINCDNITEITVKFVNQDSNEVDVYLLPGHMTMLTALLEPYTSYTILVSYINNYNFTSPVDTLTVNKTLPAAPDQAYIEDVYLLDAASAMISWAPTTKPYGIITEYEVVAVPVNGSAGENIGCHLKGYTLSMPSDVLHCIGYGFRMNQSYNILVRAKNSVGYGLFSPRHEFLATYAAPGEVGVFRNISRTYSSIFVEWSEPANKGGLVITGYKLSCQAVEYTITLKINSTKHIQHTYNVTGLPLDSTEYTCHINACNSLGCSNSSKTLQVFTTPSVPPPPSMPHVDEKKSTDNTIAIDISPVDSCSEYRVIVKAAGLNRAKRALEGDIDKACGPCCEDPQSTTECYIAAQLRREQLPMTFIVGDNKSYMGFRNAPLVTGREYQIYFGAGNQVDGVEVFRYTHLSQPVIVREYIVEKEPVLAGPVLYGIIAAVVILVAVFGFLLVFFIRQRRNKLFRFRTPDSEKVLDLNDNGSLLHNGSYQKGDAVSVDSIDMSKQPNGEPVYDNLKLKHFPVRKEELRQYIEHKSNNDGFKKEYNLIPWGLKFSHEIAKHQDNRIKNRYANIVAYDHSRVVLKGKHPERDTDYINANYIDGYKAPKEYIATQGPTQLTVNDIWYMAWQENSNIIVMVTNIVELSKVKCEQYWPDIGTKQYGDIKVTLVSSKSLAYYTIRTFTVTQNEETRTVTQFHFTAWPDHGVPHHATTLLSFLKKVRQYREPKAGPIICHCSAGVGRSGTFIALDSLLKQAELENEVDVYDYVTQMRKQRCNMIQTLDQYIFLHDAILEASEGFDTTIRTADFKSEYEVLKARQSSSDKSQLEVQFQNLEELLYVEKTTHATSAENKDRNRSANTVPSNDRRFRLLNMPSDYINATFVDDHRKRSSSIATQHPLNSTIEEFWRMVQTERPVAVVTLCASSAKPSVSKKEELPIFWPEDVNDVKEFTSLTLKMKESSRLEELQATKQTLLIVGKNQIIQQPPIEVEHYMCDFWPKDKDVPSNKNAFINLIALIETQKRKSEDKTVIVNCFDSAKQTGLFLACHSVCQQICMDSEVDIFETVKLIRNDQPMFISTVDQYGYIYEFVDAFLEQFNQSSEVFSS